MNKRIRSMIDEIFSGMKMTAENLALRDELLSNAQARYEDVMSQGKSEEEAFCEVAASLEDVYALLEEMNGEPVEQEKKEGAKAGEAAGNQKDLSGALNKAFTALGDFSQAIMPEAKKLYGQMDEATGGVLGKLGRAAKKGMRDAQKAAGEAIDKLSKENGELVFDFGANKEAKPEAKEEEKGEENAEAFVSDFADVTKSEPEKPEQADGELVLDMDALSEEEASDVAAQRMAALETEAREMEAQAAIKAVTGDEAGAEELRMRAQALYMEAALLRQRQEREKDADAAPAETAIEDEQTFAKEMEDLVQEAQDALDEQEQPAQEAEYVVRDADQPVSGKKSFPAAGLRKIDVQLDADDVKIIADDGAQVETLWEAMNVDSEPVITCEGHTLTVRRKNPDVFKTFFSAFKKEGGRITVRVPRGYAADYVISTTSGDVHIGDVDVDNVKITTTSGCVSVEPDAKMRAADLAITTVSGRVSVSARANLVAVKTVSGGQYISCDAHKVDVNVVSGNVHAEGACDEWEVSVVSGDVQLRCTTTPAKKVKISSVHADVHLALPGEIRGFVAEATGALGCEIVNEFGPNRYGTCALPIRMESMRGKLIITKM